MRFEVIGSGSIGLLYTARLLQANFSVKLWSRKVETAALINEQGITLRELEEKEYRLYCSCDAIDRFLAADHYAAADVQEECYAIVAVKQSHLNAKLMKQIKQLAERRDYQAVIAIQNGVGHIELLGEALPCPIITAVTSEGAKRTENNVVIHTGSGKTALGDELGRDQGQIFQKKLENVLQTAGFAAFVSKNIKEQIYRKLIINSIINPLTAIYNIANGELPQSELRLMLMKQLFAETKNILVGEEKTLESFQFEEVLQVCQATASNTSSMRADIIKRDTTEIACINGAVARIAARSNKRAPLNESMVHIIEALHPEK